MSRDPEEENEDDPSEEAEETASGEEEESYEEYFEEEEEKPEPLEFKDAYSAHEQKPVELVVPNHSDSFAVLEQVPERRFPAKKVAKSAAALAAALKKAAK